jgi:hypothetical protein
MILHCFFVNAESSCQTVFLFWFMQDESKVLGNLERWLKAI